MTWQSGETPGAASGAARLRERIRERIRARVRYTPEGCWVWQGQAIRGAHPIFLVENRRVYVHRVAWELAVGPIPSAHRVIRACATWLCVNPAHHVLVPHRAAPKRSEERPSRIPSPPAATVTPMTKRTPSGIAALGSVASATVGAIASASVALPPHALTRRDSRLARKALKKGSGAHHLDLHSATCGISTRGRIHRSAEDEQEQ